MNYNIAKNNRLLVVFLIPFILGSLSIFSFQPFNITILNFILIPCLFFLTVYVGKKSKNTYRKKPYLKNLFFLGYCFGIGFFFTGTYWISKSLTYDESFKNLIPFAIILIPLFLGLFFGLATLMAGMFVKNNFLSILFFCSIFSFIDFLRGKIFTGFPWNLWAYSWSWFPEILQSINVIGLYAFNLFTLIIFCSPLLLFLKKDKKNILIISLLLVIFFSNYIYGSLRINKEINKYNSETVSKNEKINIKLVSPNFNLKYNLSQQDLKNLIKKLIKYSEPKKNTKTIFVWPEGVFTGYNYNDLLLYQNLFIENFSKNHTLIFGVNTVDKNLNYFNSFIAVNNKFEVMYKYNKKKLVPFGEFLPFANILQKFGFKKITEGYGSFSKGKIQDNLNINNFEILPLICYEIIFTELIQNKKNNSNLIINISEDAWFGGSVGPQQHFAKAIFRAIENNTYLARVANQGISAFISNTGKTIKRLEPDEAGNIELNIPLINNSSKNRNDLIFFILLFTYTIIFFTFNKN